jgi:hypothetical protein
VEKPVLSTPEESEASQVKHQKHGGKLFLLRALLIRNMFLQANG